jgi:hypothetical protein
MFSNKSLRLCLKSIDFQFIQEHNDFINLISSTEQGKKRWDVKQQ